MKNRGKAARIAYPAILGAISVVLLYIASIVPSGNWGIVAVAGLFPAAVIISVGFKAGLLCWAGISVLSFLLLPGKFCALLFTVLLGLYPIVKAQIERLRYPVLEYFLKLLFFNVAFTTVYLLMSSAVLDSLPKQLEIIWILYLVGNIVFLVYDFGFSKLINVYIARIARAVK